MKWLLTPMMMLALAACGGGGGGGGSSDNATVAIPDAGGGVVLSALVSSSIAQLETDLGGVAGVSSDQVQSIAEIAQSQISADGLSGSSDSNLVLPSLLSGAIKAIGANLTGETLVNNAISQSIATVMTLLGESELTASASTGRSVALSVTMQSLLEKLVETAITSLEGLNLNSTALEQGLGNVVNAVVTNLGKAKVSASDIGEAVQSVGKSATNSLTKLSVSDTAKQSLKSQVETTMATSIDELATAESSLVMDVEALKQSATAGIETGSADLKDPSSLDKEVGYIHEAYEKGCGYWQGGPDSCQYLEFIGKGEIEGYVKTEKLVIPTHSDGSIQPILTSNMLIIDLNKDGHDDVVKFRSGVVGVGRYDGSYIEAWINNGDGTEWQNHADKYFPNISNNYRFGYNSLAVDLNDDGLLDIVHSGGIPPMIQQTNGSYEISTNPLLVTIDNAAWAKTVADIDNDGDADIIFQNIQYNGRGGANAEPVPWFIAENRSEGGLERFILHADVARHLENVIPNENQLYGYNIERAYLIDVNNDGLLDLFWNAGTWDEVDGKTIAGTLYTQPAVAINNGDLTFTYRTDVWSDESVKLLSQSGSLTFPVDLDKDGDNDIVLGSIGWDAGTYDGEPNHILWNNDGQLSVDYGTPDTLDFIGFTHAADVGDIDSDGDIDIVFVSSGIEMRNRGCEWAHIRILRNEGSGEFTGLDQCFYNYYETSSSYNAWVAHLSMDIKLADVTGDGILDLIQGVLGVYGLDAIYPGKINATFELPILDDQKQPVAPIIYFGEPKVVPGWNE